MKRKRRGNGKFRNFVNGVGSLFFGSCLVRLITAVNPLVWIALMAVTLLVLSLTMIGTTEPATIDFPRP